MLKFELPTEYILQEPLDIILTPLEDMIHIVISASYQNTETGLYGGGAYMYTFFFKGRYKNTIKFIKSLSYPYTIRTPEHGADKLHKRLDKAGIIYDKAYTDNQ